MILMVIASISFAQEQFGMPPFEDEKELQELLAGKDVPEEIRATLNQWSEDIEQNLNIDMLSDEFLKGDEFLNEGNVLSPGVSEKVSLLSGKDIPLDAIVIDQLQLKDIDVVDVLKLLSQKSGLNIIAGKNVMGKVSIYLQDVKLKDALRIILDSNDLAYKEEYGILHVMTASDFEARYGCVFGGKIHTRVIHMMHARVQGISSVLEQVKSSAGKIIIDDKSNTVIIMDSIEKVEMIVDLISEIDIPVEVAVFALNYAIAKDLGEKIEPFLTQGVGNIKYDERSNKLIVTDVMDKMDQIRQVVQAFDVKEQQVLIEAKIVQIELTDSYELGVNWQAVFAGLDDLNVNVDFDSVIDGTTEPNKGTLSLGTIANNNYTALVEALKRIGNTNILSSPSILTLNNQEAKILVGSTRPYVTTTTTTPSSGPTTTAETINFIDVGVKLYVTPTVHKDGFITMNIRPEVSSVLDELETSGGNAIPIVKTSEAETTVRIKDGVTIVIGGLIEDSESETRKKVPLLGDIPILGAAFRNRDTSTTKTEIAIFLTPRIIVGDQAFETEFSSLGSF